MPEDVVLKDRASRHNFLEFIVGKRTRSLDYLRSLHAGEALWMNSIYLSPQDISSYFSVDGGSTIGGMIPPPSQPSTEGSGGGGSHHARTPSALPNVRPLHASCAKDWLEFHCREWLILGHSLGNLVQLPLSGMEFLDVITELLLELEYYSSKPYSTGRALASRALKKDRENRGLKHHTGIQTISSLGGFTYLAVPPNLATTPDLIPSYEIVFSPLCSILQFTYRKLCDYDICAKEADFKKLLAVDRRLKHIFFGAISKEMSKLASAKMNQQRSYISENLMAAFSQGELGPSFHSFTSTTTSDDVISAVTGRGEGTNAPTTSSTGGVVVDRDSKEYFFDDDDDDIYGEEE